MYTRRFSPFATYLLLGGLAQGLNASDHGGQKRRVKLAEEYVTPFAPGGFIEIKDSFGSVHATAWDRPEVRIVVKKATLKRYSRAERERGTEELDRIEIDAFVSDDNRRILIDTNFPSRKLFSRPLRGKSNAMLTYEIHVPRDSRLYIHHDIGEVRVGGVAGDIEISNRIGAVELHVPDQDYSIHATAGIGDISTNFDTRTERRRLVGAELLDCAPGAVRRIKARVGIGEVRIEKRPDASAEEVSL